MDQIVTLETAKLAMEVGYDGNFLYQYMYGDDTPTPNMMFCDEAPIEVDDLDFDAAYPGYDIAAPTQTALSKWLREKCNLFVTVLIDDVGYWYEIYTTQNMEKAELVASCWKSRVEYEDAMENALQEACYIIKERRSE